MKNSVSSVKQKLDASIAQLCEVSWMFSKKPGVYFTRNRKLPLPKVISCLLSMEGGSLTSELLKHFGCSARTASSSAFIQQRHKISEEAFPMLFSLFAKKPIRPICIEGYGYWLQMDLTFKFLQTQIIQNPFSREPMDRHPTICFTWMLYTIYFNICTTFLSWLPRT